MIQPSLFTDDEGEPLFEDGYTEEVDDWQKIYELKCGCDSRVGCLCSDNYLLEKNR